MKEEMIARMKAEGDKARVHAEHQRKQRAKDRREKIATALLAGMLAAEHRGFEYACTIGRTRAQNATGDAVEMADALIAALDKETP